MRMFTEDDVRDVLTATEDDAPDMRQLRERIREQVGPAHASPIRSNRRARRWTAAVSAAAAVLAAVVVTEALVDGGQRDPVTPGQHGTGGTPLTTYSFAVTPPTGTRVVTRSVEAGHQTVVLAADGGDAPTTDAYGSITVYDRGRFAARADGRATQVDGHRGFSAVLADSTITGVGSIFGNSSGPSDGVGTLPSLAWQYAPGRWAVAQVVGNGATMRALGSPVSQAELARLRTIAAATRVGAGSQVRSPVTLGHLPEGLQRRALTVAPGALLQGRRVDGVRFELALQQTDAPGRTALSVQVSATRPASSQPDPALPSDTPEPHASTGQRRLHGVEWVLGTTEGPSTGGDYERFPQISARLDGATVVVTGRPGMSAQDLVAIADGLRLAPRPWSEQSWFPGSRATP